MSCSVYCELIRLWPSIFLFGFKVLLLMCTIFKVFIAFFLLYCFCSMFCFSGHEACGILAPQAGIEPTFPALEG